MSKSKGINISMKLLVASPKGGVGKTTTSTNLAVKIASTGNKVGLVDIDHNRNSVKWGNYRDQQKEIPLKGEIKIFDLFGKENIDKAILEIEEELSNVLIDSGGYDSSAFREALLCADAIIVPSRPNQADVESAGEVIELIEEANTIRVNDLELDPIKVYVYITQVPTNTKVTALDDARNAFKQVEDVVTVLNAVNYDRIAYSRAYGMGLSVIEMSVGATKAAEEVNALAEELFG